MLVITDAIREDKALYALIAGFTTISFATSYALGETKWFTPLAYTIGWSYSLLSIFGIIIVYYGIFALRSPNPIGIILNSLQVFISKRAHGFVLFSGISLFYGSFTSMKMMMPEMMPFTFDVSLADLDENLNFGPAWKHLRFLDPYTEIIIILYNALWFFILTAGTFLACVAKSNLNRSQYLWTFFLCWIILGNLVALSVMSVGPIFYEKLLGVPRFSELTAHLAPLVSPNNPPTLFPQILWNAYVTKSAGIGHGISAFPSLHVSMATLFALSSLRIRASLGWIMIGYLFVILAGSIHLGWHYAVDGYFSIVATVVIWKVVGIFLRAVQDSAENVGPLAQPT